MIRRDRTLQRRISTDTLSCPSQAPVGRVPDSSERRPYNRSMSRLFRLRQRAGALLHDWPRFERHMISGAWPKIRNRNEIIATDGRGVRCEWRFTSDLHLANVFPSAAARLMRRAFDEW